MKYTKYLKGWCRTLCLICVVVFTLTACIGCVDHATTEELAALKAEVTTATQELESLKSEQAATKEELSLLDLAHKLSQQEIKMLKGEAEEAQDEIDALKDANKAAQDEIDALKDANKTAQKEIDALKDANKAAQDEIDALKDANKTAQDEIDALKDANKTAQEEIEQLKQQIQDLQDQINAGETIEKIRIYIDQGHNPTSKPNAGASGNGVYEENLTFTIGTLLAQLLKDDDRFEVRLSRPTADTVLGTDNTSSLAARVQGAQDFGADYFISLHTNAFDDANVHGIEVLVAEQDSESYNFGNSLLQGLLGATNLNDRGMKLRPDLYVLRNATMPAALLEMGFITNPEEAALLSQSPELFANGIYAGILSYFHLPVPTVD